MRNRGLVLALGLVTVLAGCSDGGDLAANTSVDSTMANAATSAATTTSTVAVTTTTRSGTDDWVAVGGSELDDSRVTPSRIKALSRSIGEAKSSGELHLGAIDGYWAEALDMLDDGEDRFLVEAEMEKLAEVRDAALLDLPSALHESAEVIAAAVINRDYESRVAAYQLLHEVVISGAELAPQENMVHSLYFALQEDVGGQMLRESVLASGRIGPRLDPESLPDLPDRVLLVQWGDGIRWDEIVVLVGLDGSPIGHIDPSGIGPGLEMTIVSGVVAFGFPTQGVHNDVVTGCVESWVGEDRTYLICDDTTSYRNPEWRAEVRVRYPNGTTERLGGAGYSYVEENPSHPVAGHWRAVYPNDDGSAVLGQWSGECESPSAHMIFRGEVSTGFGNEDDSWPESHALGWRDNAHALVAISSGACSGDAPGSGIYTVTPQGDSEPLYLTPTGGVAARLVSPNDALPVPIVKIPVSDAVDARRYFDDFETTRVDLGSGTGLTGLRNGNPMLMFMCDDVDVFVGPVVEPDRERLLVEAAAVVDESGCTPKVPGPIEVLGVAGDPPGTG